MSASSKGLVPEVSFIGPGDPGSTEKDCGLFVALLECGIEHRARWDRKLACSVPPKIDHRCSSPEDRLKRSKSFSRLKRSKSFIFVFREHPGVLESDRESNSCSEGLHAMTALCGQLKETKDRGGARMPHSRGLRSLVSSGKPPLYHQVAYALLFPASCLPL